MATVRRTPYYVVVSAIVLCALVVLFRRGSTPKPEAFPKKDPVPSSSRVVDKPRPVEHTNRVTEVSGSETTQPASPEPFAAASTSSVDLREEQLRKAFETLLRKYRDNVSNLGAVHSRFRAERLLFRREGRLLAAAFPNLAETLATPIARDTRQDRWDRNYCTELLAMLAPTGSSTVVTTLRSLVDDGDGNVNSAALYGLGQADPDGKNKALYWAKCRQDSPTAFVILGNWVDSGTISEMNSLLGTPLRKDAQDVLNKLDILSRPNWADRLIEIVRGKPADFDEPVEWALYLMKLRAPERLKPVLREELDKAFENAKRALGDRGWDQRVSQEYSMADDVSKSMGTKFYDDMLVVYWESGGQLRAFEKARLRYFGYASDPKVRLAELLAEQK